jgi:hypothetical protein
MIDLDSDEQLKKETLELIKDKEFMKSLKKSQEEIERGIL